MAIDLGIGKRGDALDAEALQQSVISEELKQVNDLSITYTDEQVRLAIVHARQDIILLVAWLNSANKRLRYIQWTLWGAIAWIALRESGWV